MFSRSGWGRGAENTWFRVDFGLRGPENTSFWPPSGCAVTCFLGPAGAGGPKTRRFGHLRGAECRVFSGGLQLGDRKHVVLRSPGCEVPCFHGPTASWVGVGEPGGVSGWSRGSGEVRTGTAGGAGFGLRGRTRGTLAPEGPWARRSGYLRGAAVAGLLAPAGAGGGRKHVRLVDFRGRSATFPRPNPGGGAFAACPRAPFCTRRRGFGSTLASGGPQTNHFGHLGDAG